MTNYQPFSIRSVGLKEFLDSTTKKHHNQGYQDFKTFIESNVNVTNLARVFNVTRPTAVKWLEIYYEENPKKPVAK